MQTQTFILDAINRNSFLHSPTLNAMLNNTTVNIVLYMYFSMLVTYN